MIRPTASTPAWYRPAPSRCSARRPFWAACWSRATTTWHPRPSSCSASPTGAVDSGARPTWWGPRSGSKERRRKLSAWLPVLSRFRTGRSISGYPSGTSRADHRRTTTSIGPLRGWQKARHRRRFRESSPRWRPAISTAFPRCTRSASWRTPVSRPAPCPGRTPWSARRRGRSGCSSPHRSWSC